MKLEVTQLSTITIVRPEGALGTCGFYPKAWQAAVVSPGEDPKEAFLEHNRLWSYEDLE